MAPLVVSDLCATCFAVYPGLPHSDRCFDMSWITVIWICEVALCCADEISAPGVWVSAPVWERSGETGRGLSHLAISR